VTLGYILESLALVLFVAGWLLYFRERGRSRDYVTDLMDVVHEYDLGRDDLRRSLKWSEVEEQVGRATEEDVVEEGPT